MPRRDTEFYLRRLIVAASYCDESHLDDLEDWVDALMEGRVSDAIELEGELRDGLGGFDFAEAARAVREEMERAGGGYQMRATLDLIRRIIDRRRGGE